MIRVYEFMSLRVYEFMSLRVYEFMSLRVYELIIYKSFFKYVKNIKLTSRVVFVYIAYTNVPRGI